MVLIKKKINLLWFLWKKKNMKMLLKRNRLGLSEHMICEMTSEMRFVGRQVKDNPIKSV